LIRFTRFFGAPPTHSSRRLCLLRLRFSWALPTLGRRLCLLHHRFFAGSAHTRQEALPPAPPSGGFLKKSPCTPKTFIFYYPLGIYRADFTFSSLTANTRRGMKKNAKASVKGLIFIKFPSFARDVEGAVHTGTHSFLLISTYSS